MSTEDAYLLNATKSGNYGSRENTYTSSFQSDNSGHMIQSLDNSNRRRSIHVSDPCTNTSWPKTEHLSALILHMNAFCWFLIIIGCLSCIIHGAMWPCFVYLLGQIIDRLFFEQTLLTLSNENKFISSQMTSDALNSTLKIINSQSFSNGSNLIVDFYPLEITNNLIITLLSLIGIIFLSSYLQSLCWQFSFERQVYIMHQDFLYQLLRQDADWLWKSEFTPNLLNDLECIRNGISLHLGSFIEYSTTLITSIIIGFCMDWKLMSIVLFMPFLVMLLFSFTGQFLERNLNRSNELLALSRNKIVESIERIRCIAAWMGQKIELKNYKITLQALLQAEKSANFCYSLSIGLVIFIFYALFALFTWCGAYLKQSNSELSVGDMYVVIFLALTAMFSITHIAPNIEAIIEADNVCTHLFPIIKKVPFIDSYSSKGKALHDFKGNIQFENVSFTSPSQKSGFGYIHDINFELKPNTITAIISSEYYNTSLLKFLLFRLFDPLKGQIFFDEYDMRTLNVHWLRGEIGIIEENPIFLSDFLIDNILGGLDAVPFDNIVRAAKATFTHDLILTLPQGYATVIKNVTLSPEEKQIISMVRIMLQNPKIVIIEELEKYENEDRFEAALDAIRFKRTVIVFTKRIPALKKANRILLFQDGWIVADGTFEQINQNGNFSKCNGFYKSENNGEDENLQRTSSCSKQIVLNPSSKNKNKDFGMNNAFKFLRYCRSMQFVIGIIFAILFGACAPMFAFFLSKIFYLYLTDAAYLMKRAVEVAVCFLILALISGVIYTLRHYLFEMTGAIAVLKLKTHVFTSILNQPPSWFDNDRSHRSNTLFDLLTDNTLSSILDKGLGPLFSSFVTTTCGVIIALIYCWPLTLITLLGLLSIIFLALLSVTSIWKKTTDFYKHMNEAMQVLCEAINNLWSIQMLRLENKMLESFVEKLTIPYFMYKRQAHIYSFAFALYQSAVYFLYFIIFTVGNHLIKQWFYLPSDIFSCFLFLTVCGVSLTQFINQWKVWKQISEAAYQFFQFTNSEGNFSCERCRNGLQPEITGKVTFQNVHFKNKSSKPVLENVSFTLEPSQLIAIVGKHSGSAVLNLLARFNEPNSGQVMLDDVNIKLISIEHLRKICNFICKPFITPGTLHDNIVYGLDDNQVNSKDVEVAACISGVTKFLWSLPGGWNTVLRNKEEEILKLSDQFRIALARSYLRNPKIVMIDDIFDELPDKEVQDVLKLLQSFCKNRTCIILTSNEYILRNVDRIISLDEKLTLSKQNSV